ncbi:MAG: alpha/beta hydrolase [Erythrobacter sp. RIFCSPHIGHO2_12_FULL_63_10]|nr:MAG: alpha/beta hydrolase [Erythrobacter sp. RIFCSPHIGHO2_12_FULL_63_10]
MRRLFKALLALAALLVIAYVLLRTPDTDPAEMRAKYGAAPSQFVELNGGLTVHLRDEGPENGDADAPVIVLLHGSNADLHTWQPWVLRLKQDFRVIRFDTIGHGLTGAAPGKDYSPAAMAQLVEHLANRLSLKHFVLAGNSMGGAVAVTYALEHPERLDGLVLVDAGGAPKKGNERGNIGFKLAAMPGVNALMQSVTPRSLIERSLDQSVSNKAVVTDATVDRYWELLRFPGNREATMLRFSTVRETFDPARLQTIRLPTLIMWGEEDALIGLDGANWFHENIAGSRLATFPDIGHLPHEEAPDLTVATLRDWMAGLQNGRKGSQAE